MRAHIEYTRPKQRRRRVGGLPDEVRRRCGPEDLNRRLVDHHTKRVDDRDGGAEARCHDAQRPHAAAVARRKRRVEVDSQR